MKVTSRLRVCVSVSSFDGFVDHLKLSLQRHLYMPSSHLLLTMSTTDRLQRVLNVAARVGILVYTRKFDRGLTQLRHSKQHWLDIPERIQNELGVTVHQCL